MKYTPAKMMNHLEQMSRQIGRPSGELSFDAFIQYAADDPGDMLTRLELYRGHLLDVCGAISGEYAHPDVMDNYVDDHQYLRQPDGSYRQQHTGALYDPA